ncbi:hypothetical protein ABK040_010372 [Willaertia magna]
MKFAVQKEEENLKKRKNIDENKFCKELAKKLKDEILQYDHNNLFSYFDKIQYFFKKDKNKLITNLPVEILINILQFVKIKYLLNVDFYLICKNWFKLLFNNEYYWTLQYLNYFKKTLQNKKLTKLNNTTQIFTKILQNRKNKQFLNNFNWKNKRNYLILKYNKYRQHLINNKYNCIHIVTDSDNREINYNQLINFTKNNFFTTNTTFTKINVIKINRYEHETRGFKSNGKIKGNYFHNKFPIYFKFLLKFNIRYEDDNNDDENKEWDYCLKFYKEEEKINVLEKVKEEYVISERALEKIKEWLQLENNADVNDWFCNVFCNKELSFLNLNDEEMGLLDKYLKRTE